MDAPAWFRAAIEQAPARATVQVDGCPIAYRSWGEAGRPGLVLVHGGGAHAGWWDHVGPLLAAEYRVVAPDLSGHGDSGHRERYPTETWAAEVMAVAADGRIAGRPIVVAHSMGGWVAIAAAAASGEHLAGIVILDSPVRRAAPEELAAAEGVAFGPRRTYPSVEAALGRFRTVPDQPTSLDYVIDHVARESLVEVEGGWRWKFDPKVFDRRVPTGDELQGIRCRVALFRSEHGLVTADTGEYMYEQLGRIAPVVEIPLAWHHVMLDQPLSLVTGVRTLLADWEHSTPHRRGGPERDEHLEGER